MSEPLMIRGRPPRSTVVALLQAQGLPVAENARGKGLGSTLIDHAEQFAALKGVRSMYLLTTTAEALFKRLGYERVERSKAPPSIARTSEFAGLCPASSAFMSKQI